MVLQHMVLTHEGGLEELLRWTNKVNLIPCRMFVCFVLKQNSKTHK